MLCPRLPGRLRAESSITANALEANHWDPARKLPATSDRLKRVLKKLLEAAHRIQQRRPNLGGEPGSSP